MTRKAKLVVAAAALVLSAAPAALAAPGSPDAHDRATAPHAAPPQDASDRANGATAVVAVTGIKDAHDRVGAPASAAYWSANGTRGVDTMQSGGGVTSYPEHLADVSPAAPTVLSPGGFDWGDAAIGVLGGIGLSLLLGGGLILLVGHGRTRQRVAIR